MDGNLCVWNLRNSSPEQQSQDDNEIYIYTSTPAPLIIRDSGRPIVNRVFKQNLGSRILCMSHFYWQETRELVVYVGLESGDGVVMHSPTQVVPPPTLHYLQFIYPPPQNNNFPPPPPLPLRKIAITIRSLQMLINTALLITAIINEILNSRPRSQIGGLTVMQSLYAGFFMAFYIWMIVTEVRRQRVIPLSVCVVEFLAMVLGAAILYLNLMSDYGEGIPSVVILGVLLVLSSLALVHECVVPAQTGAR
ncbi:hypothetical protein HK098_003563 [Nowakowskiella sp. JEL0407]|nr:hypothetical protein HK098_003563 [Nowakowskiella sp. JEL0407]